MDQTLKDLINFDKLLVKIDDEWNNSETEKPNLLKLKHNVNSKSAFDEPLCKNYNISDDFYNLPTDNDKVVLGKVHPFKNVNADSGDLKIEKVSPLIELKELLGIKNKSDEISQIETDENEPNETIIKDLISFDENLIVIDDECENFKKTEKPNVINSKYIDDLKPVFDKHCCTNSNISVYWNNKPSNNDNVVLGKVHPFQYKDKDANYTGITEVSPFQEFNEAPRYLVKKLGSEEINVNQNCSSIKHKNLIDLFEDISVTPKDITTLHHLQSNNFGNSEISKNTTADYNSIKYEFHKKHANYDPEEDNYLNTSNNCRDLQTLETTKDNTTLNVTGHVTINCERAFVITPGNSHCSCSKLDVDATINTGAVPKKLENGLKLEKNKEKHANETQSRKELSSSVDEIQHNTNKTNLNVSPSNKLAAPNHGNTKKMLPIILDRNHAQTRLNWEKEKVAIDHFIWKK